jgi:hypothetical protein
VDRVFIKAGLAVTMQKPNRRKQREQRVFKGYR